jgi:hypothetical protein
VDEPQHEPKDPLLAVARNVPADAALWRGFAAALGAAVVGAVVWMLIVIVSDYEVGIVAWGIGALAGYAVLLATNGRRGFTLQAAAIVAAVIGILIGKYLTFWWSVKDAVEALGLSTWDVFWDDLGAVFSWFDALWIGLAVITAWRILQPETAEDVGPKTEHA